jgi:PAS domain-containing protein
MTRSARPKAEAQVSERTEALRKSEQRYRQLIDVTPDAIFVHSDERVVLANPAMARMFGAGASSS